MGLFVPSMACGLLLAMSIPVMADRWKPIPRDTTPLQLPRLAEKLKLDGQIDEWGSAICIPLRYKSDHAARGRNWTGIFDGSAIVYFSWNKDGLCLAVEATDDDIVSRVSGQPLLTDGFQIQIGLSNEKDSLDLLRGPKNYDVTFRPPAESYSSPLIAESGGKKVGTIRAVGKRTGIGYTEEILIPWNMFSKFIPAPGAEFGANLQYMDVDEHKRDELTIFLMQGDWAGKTFRLVDDLAYGPDVILGPAVGIDSSKVYTDIPLQVKVDVGGVLVSRGKKVRLVLKDNSDAPVFSQEVDLGPPPCRTGGLRSAQFVCAAAIPDGYYSVQAVILDKNNRTLGSASRPSLYIGNTLAEAFTRLAAAKIPRLSQKSPFKAQSYLAAAALLDWLRNCTFVWETGEVAIAKVLQMKARLDILDGRPTANLGKYDVLNLAANPDAQVTVGFADANRANIGFNWGSILLASGSVSFYQTPKAAAEALEVSFRSVYVLPMESTTINGYPARSASESFQTKEFGPADFAPDKQVLLANSASQTAAIIDMKYLPGARVEAVAILPGCPERVRSAVLTWANGRGLPVADITSALKRTRFLVAGDVRPILEKNMAGYTSLFLRLVDGPACIRVCRGERIVESRHASRRVAEMTAGLITANKAVTVSEVDALRKTTLKYLGSRTPRVQLPEGLRIYCGDVHSHTTYSDGDPAPLGLCLEAIAEHLDFVVISDHNTIDAALLARKLLAEYGVNYPVTVGEEVSTDWAHLNAYPISKLVSWNVPAADIIRSAHEQNAVIQWNHPGNPLSPWAQKYLNDGIEGTGLDAWENYPRKYDEWKKAGKLPLVIGSTDSHDGTFSAPARTIIFAPSPQGWDIAEAVRSRREIGLLPTQPHLLCGSDIGASYVYAALAESKALKSAKTKQLTDALRCADIVGLLRVRSRHVPNR